MVWALIQLQTIKYNAAVAKGLVVNFFNLLEDEVSPWSLCFCITLQQRHRSTGSTLYGSHHRRWISTEEKSKVVAAAWETAFIQFLAVLAILH